MELYVALSWNKMDLYSLLDNIPTNSNMLVFNLKWMGSDINSAIFPEKISVVDVESQEDFIETLNTVLIKGNIKSEKVILIKPGKIPVYNILSAAVSRLSKRQVSEGYGYYVFWYDKEIIKNVSFKESNIDKVFSNFIEQLTGILNYNSTEKKAVEKSNVVESKKAEVPEVKEAVNKKKYKTIIYTRCQERLFNEIKNSGVCDTLYSINFGRNNLNIKLINLTQRFAMEEYFIMINHYSSSVAKCLEKLRKLEITIPTTISDNNGNEIYVINKKHILKLNMNNYYTDVEILKLLKTNSPNKIVVENTVETPKKIESQSIEKQKKAKNKRNNYFIFVLPFMNNGDRQKLFEESIKNLKYQIDASSIDAEILVHECGDRKTLSKDFIDEYIDQYMFNKYTDVFHRAWCFNVASRYCNLPTNKENIYFVFMDSDILLNSTWIGDLQYIDEKMLIGWNELFDLTEECTNRLYDTDDPVDFSSLSYRQKRYPSIYGACGGVTIVRKDVFFEIKGFPEYFKGSWGGEDNAFMNKAIAFRLWTKNIWQSHISPISQSQDS